MLRKFTRIVMIAAFCVFAGGAFAGAMASEAYEPVDPKKKQAGEECKTSDECQKHHACTKSGDKNICTAPPRPKLPPGVVT